jgi:hypothetical protein
MFRILPSLAHRNTVSESPMLTQHDGEAWDESSGECLERREQTRYGLRALVDFDWTDNEGVPHRGEGFTRDISTKGMFIYSEAQPPEKADIQVEVSLGSIPDALTNLQIAVEALVIRVDPALDPGILHGFAVLNRSCKLHNGSPHED